MHHDLKYNIIKLSENIRWRYTLYDFNSIPFVEVYLMNQDRLYFGDCPRELEQNCIFCCCWVNCLIYVCQISFIYCVVHIFYILLVFYLIALTAAKSRMYYISPNIIMDLSIASQILRFYCLLNRYLDCYVFMMN